MLERKISKELEKWQKEENKPCLLVRGARQVGKTFIIDQFCQSNYDCYYYINFSLQKEYKSIFNDSLDAKYIIMQLETIFNKKFIPGKTVLFLDEIQDCPNARTAIKPLVLNKEIDVIASGSLLGLYYKEVTSYPVGYERIIDMYPMDFEEFLWEIGLGKDIISYARECFLNIKEMPDAMLKSLEEKFKMFMIVGGMPKVVDTYIKTNSLLDVLSVQKSIVEDYKQDVLKYSSFNDRKKILDVFNSIPAQLGKKFKYNSINNEKVKSSKYSNSILWLKDAGIVNCCYNLTEPAASLMTNIRLDSFKIYMRDTGLLIAMLEKGTQNAILSNNLYINEGTILENLCAEEIMTRYQNDFYFEKKSKLEIDFVLNIDGVITALEVKSGNNKQAKSLNSIIDNYKTVGRFIKLEHNTNIYKDKKGIEHYPLFMIMFI